MSPEVSSIVYRKSKEQKITKRTSRVIDSTRRLQLVPFHPRSYIYLISSSVSFDRLSSRLVLCTLFSRNDPFPFDLSTLKLLFEPQCV